MTDGDWTHDIDIRRPSPARMYDYYLGGTHNFAADREAADQVAAAIPNIRDIAKANRAFLRNAVRHLLDNGVRQFLDIGSGIPTVGNVHEIAQRHDPHSRVVYADIDPIAVAHSVNLLKNNKHATAIRADLRYPEAILTHSGLRNTLDLDQPVGLLLVSVLQFVPDEDAYPAVRQLGDALAAGSYLVISHVAAEGLQRDSSTAAAQVYQRSTVSTGALRSRAQINEFFADYPLTDPGLVWVSQWQPGTVTDVGDHPERIAMLAGVGQKAAPLH